jgi:hypothetical protein
VDQEQEVVVRKETLGPGKVVIYNLNHHPEERMSEERTQEEITPEKRIWET